MSAYASVVAEILFRLNYHSASNEILAGMKVFGYPVASVEGMNDLPQVRIGMPEVQEQFRVRLPRLHRMEVRLLVSTRREGGVAAHLVWVEKVLDAIEKKSEIGTAIDPLLNNMLRKPLDVRSSGSFAEDLTLNQALTLTVAPKTIVQSGKRRL